MALLQSQHLNLRVMAIVYSRSLFVFFFFNLWETLKGFLEVWNYFYPKLSAIIRHCKVSGCFFIIALISEQSNKNSQYCWKPCKDKFLFMVLGKHSSGFQCSDTQLLRICERRPRLAFGGHSWGVCASLGFLLDLKKK